MNDTQVITAKVIGDLRPYIDLIYIETQSGLRYAFTKETWSKTTHRISKIYG